MIGKVLAAGAIGGIVLGFASTCAIHDAINKPLTPIAPITVQTVTVPQTPTPQTTTQYDPPGGYCGPIYPGGPPFEGGCPSETTEFPMPTMPEPSTTYVPAQPSAWCLMHPAIQYCGLDIV